MKMHLLLTVMAITSIIACTTTPDMGTTNSSTEIIAQTIKSTTKFKIDTIKEQDQPWEVFSQQVEKEKFVKQILDAVYSGKQKAYDAIMDENKEIPLEEVRKIISTIDTLQVEDIGKPGTFKQVLVKNEVLPSDISQVVFNEQWIMSKDKFHMEKKVISACLCKNSYDQSGTLRGIRPLFFVRFQ